eukprot:Clim_evm102s157 gene=Clim_evmTU102s157
MASSKISVVMCGTGEYTTGFVHDSGSTSDKKAGVVALSCFEMRRLGKIDQVAMAGVNGTKFPGIREHMKEQIQDRYGGLDISCETYPNDDRKDPESYLMPFEKYKDANNAVIIFTPDDTHYKLAKDALERGFHVLVTKPVTKWVREHQELVRIAKEKGLLFAGEFHKRFDPIYADGRQRARTLGKFQYFTSYMSQPKQQLKTFRQWAGKSSDISYYLNAHHIDWHVWTMSGIARPTQVHAMCSTGIADSPEFGCVAGTEDVITLCVSWENLEDGSKGHATYTSSWAASKKAEVHSQQRFFYTGHGGEVRVDQAHRGYESATDTEGYKSNNPLYMAYLPGPDGRFAGHHGYGYKSFELFIDACRAINSGAKTIDDFKQSLALGQDTVLTTAILEAGWHSLQSSKPVALKYDADGEYVEMVLH